MEYSKHSHTNQNEAIDPNQSRDFNPGVLLIGRARYEKVTKNGGQ